MVDVLCLYSSCQVDSFTAAWVVRSYYRDRIPEVNVKYVPVSTGEYPPPPGGRDVIMLGLQCSAFHLRRLIAQARSVLLIGTTILDPDFTILESPLKLFAVFDDNRSVSMLTHEHFFGRVPVPRIVLRSRDILPDQQGHGVSDLLSSPDTFEVWDHADAILGTEPS